MIRNIYLTKTENETISIDNIHIDNIPQHNINSLRFLYSQYKKKKPGVIINYHKGFNRNIIALFVKAMCHKFKQPVLVLCQEGAEHGWMEQFQTWTDLCDDVVLETQKPHIKKQVLINTMANLSFFCSRNWSVLVVDSPETDKATLQVLERFRADYKIWITPINIKENLDHFSKVYKWLYPKEKFDINKFIPNTNDLNDIVEKAILLDAFVEDIVAENEEDTVKNDTEDSDTDIKMDTLNSQSQVHLFYEPDSPTEIDDVEIQEEDKLYVRNDISTKSLSTIQIESENNEINKENDFHDDDDELEPKDEVCLGIKSPNQTKPLQICDELNPSDNKIFISDEVQMESNCNDVNDDKSLVTNDKAVTVSNTLKHKCIDDKLKELEEKVMKRFKGSILDSLI